MYKKNYLKAVVIVHGKSEKQMCEWIKQNLRLQIHIESSAKGKTSIQITSLMNTLKNTIYKNYSSFKRHFNEKLEPDLPKDKLLPDYFKIFIIMDTDDCTKEEKDNYINKKMFENHWAYDYIVPLYNSPDLESVLIKSEVASKNKKELKKSYAKIFPTDKTYLKSDEVQLFDFVQKIKQVKETNMELFIEYCLNLIK